MRIIYFDLDCIRNDHLGCYGYHRDTSPTIDAIARDALVFDGCYTTNSPCVPSRAALFTGRFGINNGIVRNTDRPVQFSGHARGKRHREMPMVMRHLRANGVRPISFSNFADRHNTWWFHSGWDEFHLINLRCGFETADEVNAVALPWLKDHAAEDDYFLHIHYWDIHFPYRCPDMPKWMEIFKDEPPPDWPDEDTIKHQHETIYGTRCASNLWGRPNQWTEACPWMPLEIASREDFKALIDGYDGAIRFVDHHMAQVFDILREKGVLDDTVIIIGGDHGDCFGEGGGHYMDHTLAAEPVMKRPLIIKWPGVTTPGRCDAFVYLLDLAPTLCEMLDMPVPTMWDGQSFAGALRGRPFDGKDYLVLDHGMSTVQRAVRTKDHLYVRTLNPGHYPIDEPCWLFDMNADPLTIHDIAADRPDVVKEHESLLDRWREEQMTRHGPHADPLEEMAARSIPSPERAQHFAARLREKGRADQAEDYVERMKRLRADLGSD